MATKEDSEDINKRIYYNGHLVLYKKDGKTLIDVKDYNTNPYYRETKGDDKGKSPEAIYKNRIKESVDSNSSMIKIDPSKFGKKLNEADFYETYYPVVKDALKGSKVSPELAMIQLSKNSDWGKNITKDNGFSQAFSKLHGNNEKGSFANTQDGPNLSTYKTFGEAVKGFANSINSNPKILSTNNVNEQYKLLQKSGLTNASEDLEVLDNKSRTKLENKGRASSKPNQFVEVDTEASRAALIENGYDSDDERLRTLGVVFTKDDGARWNNSVSYPGMHRSVMTMPTDYDLINANGKQYILNNDGGAGQGKVISFNGKTKDGAGNSLELGINTSTSSNGSVNVSESNPPEFFAEEASEYVKTINQDNKLTDKNWKTINEYNDIIENISSPEDEEAYKNDSSQNYYGSDWKPTKENINNSVFKYQQNLAPLWIKELNGLVKNTEDRLKTEEDKLSQLILENASDEELNKQINDVNSIKQNLERNKADVKNDINALEWAIDPDFNIGSKRYNELQQANDKKLHWGWGENSYQKKTRDLFKKMTAENQALFREYSEKFKPAKKYDGTTKEETTNETITNDVNLQVDNPNSSTTYGYNQGGGSSSYTGSNEVVVNNLEDGFEADNIIEGNFIPKTDSAKTLQDKLKNVNNAINTANEEVEQVGEYAPDNQGLDYGGFIGDAGRALVGMSGAMGEIPKYETGEMYNMAKDDLTARRDLGLTDEELSYGQNLAERGYGYDVKNVRRLAGGSSGVALGNLGRAQQQLYGQYANLGVQDQAARRANRKQFNQFAVKDEVVNRQMFEDDLGQAMMNKQAGAALVGDALGNISERNQFNKAYGKGSAFYEKQKSDWTSTEQEKINAKEALKYNKEKYNKDLQDQKAEYEAELDKISDTGKVLPIVDNLADNTNAFISTDNTNANTTDNANEITLGDYSGNNPTNLTGDVNMSNTVGDPQAIAEMKRLMEEEGKSMAEASSSEFNTFIPKEDIAIQTKPGTEDIEGTEIPDETINAEGKPLGQSIVDSTDSPETNTVAREDQTPEDKMADYKAEFKDDAEKTKKYEADPIAFLKEDIAGWESQPDSEEKTQSIKNLTENLEILNNEQPGISLIENAKTNEEANDIINNFIEQGGSKEEGDAMAEAYIAKDWTPSIDQVSDAADAGIIGTGIGGTEATKQDNKKIYEWLNNKEATGGTDETTKQISGELEVPKYSNISGLNNIKDAQGQWEGDLAVNDNGELVEWNIFDEKWDKSPESRQPNYVYDNPKDYELFKSNNPKSLTDYNISPFINKFNSGSTKAEVLKDIKDVSTNIKSTQMGDKRLTKVKSVLNQFTLSKAERKDMDKFLFSEDFKKLSEGGKSYRDPELPSLLMEVDRQIEQGSTDGFSDKFLKNAKIKLTLLDSKRTELLDKKIFNLNQELSQQFSKNIK